MKMLQWTSAMVGAALLSGLVFASDADAQATQSNSGGTNAQAQSTTSSTAGAASVSGNTGNNQGVSFNGPDTTTYRGGYSIYLPPNISAPNLTTTLTDTCMGSWSAGLSVPGGGLTFGKTQIDDDCVARLHARQLVAMNAGDLGMEVLCTRDVVRTADAKMASPRCIANREAKEKNDKKAANEPPIMALSSTSPGYCPGYNGNDPVVRKRRGCQ